MKRTMMLLGGLMTILTIFASALPHVTEKPSTGCFPLVTTDGAATICTDARIDRMFLGLWPPFQSEPHQRIAASAYQKSRNSREGHIVKIAGLGYEDGVLVQPFDTPSYDTSARPRHRASGDTHPSRIKTEMAPTAFGSKQQIPSPCLCCKRGHFLILFI